MYNPFEELSREIKEIKELLLRSSTSPLPLGNPNQAKEIVNTATLCVRLDLTEPTIITWRKKGRIPFLKIGSAIRYDWVEVVKALENKKVR